MFLCGIDEAGRGPLAGPVCAAAVILSDDFPACGLDDSKRLNSAAREKLKVLICQLAAAWGIGWASPAEIDELNIHNATLLAMKRSFKAMLCEGGETLSAGKIHAVIDGLFAPDIGIP